MNPNPNFIDSRPSPRKAWRRNSTGMRTACRAVPLLLALLTLMCLPQVRAQTVPLIINAPPGIAGSFTPTSTVTWAPIDAFTSITSEVVYVGRGCPGDVYLANPAGKIALMDRGLCSISVKVDRAARAGAIGVLVAMDTTGNPVSFAQSGGSLFVPTLIIRKSDGDRIKANLAAPVSVTLGLPAGTPGVQTTSSGDLTLTSATVTGRVFSNGVDTTVYFEYQTSSGPVQSTAPQNVGIATAPVTVSASLSGLSAGTFYFYRLVATGGGKTVRATDRGFATPTLPNIWRPVNDVAVMAGENAFFYVQADGTQPLTYQWEHEGSVVVPFEYGSYSLELWNVQPADAGEYRVGIMNPYTDGVPVYSAPGHLTVYPAVPPTVSSVTVGEIGPAGARLSGEANPNGGKVRVYFEVGPTTSYGINSPPVINDSNSFDPMPATALAGMTRDVNDANYVDNYYLSYWSGPQATALQPDTTYHCRMVAVSTGGTTYGPDTTFTTTSSTTHTVTNADDDGPGSLRDTVTQADLSDTIVFAPELNGQTIHVSRPLLLQKWLHIIGPGAEKLTLSGDTVRRVISVSAGLEKVMISGLTIKDGSAPQGGSEGGGGAIYNQGNLELDRCVFLNNVAPLYRVYRGGAIWHRGNRLVVSNCQFTGNYAQGGGGALNNDIQLNHGTPEFKFPVTTIVNNCTFTANTVSSDYDFWREDISSAGGAIQTTRGIEITNCTFTGNDNLWGFQGGGAIYSTTPSYDYSGDSNAAGTTLVNCTFRQNHCGGAGGAIQNDPGLSMRVTGCTFVDNVADWGAGTIMNRGNLYLKNSTFSGNYSEVGGAISNGDGSVTMLGCTLSANQSNAGGSIANVSGEFSIGNTLLDGQLSGSFTSLGHNIIRVGDESDGWTAADLVGSAIDPVDVRIGLLADNGGPTWTHALLPGSPAIDSGDTALANSSEDQRGAGYPRLYGMTVDVGAYEVSDPFTIHGDVLFDLNLLRQSTTDSRDVTRLTNAIKKLNAALVPALWEDPYRLVPATGDGVFSLDLALLEILQEIRSGTAAPQVRSMADRIARAGREIAATEIADAAFSGGATQKALEKLAKGDEALALGKSPASAVAHFQTAWKESLKAKK